MTRDSILMTPAGFGSTRWSNSPKLQRARLGEEASMRPKTTDDGATERKIDQILADSFPASDPPPWTLGVRSAPVPGEEEESHEQAMKDDDPASRP